MICLSLATEADLTLILAWRNNPLVYDGFYSQKKPIAWNEHLSWYRKRNADWREFIIIFDDRKVGVVTICQLDHWSPEIGFFVGEVSLWGRGIGKEAGSLALKWLKEHGYQYTHTTVLETNERALNLLKSLGFTILGQAREGEIWLQLKIP